MSDDLIRRSDAIEAVSKVDDYGDGIGFEVRSHCLVELELVPSADRPQGEWIPCSERLPKIEEHHVSETCLVYCSNGAYAFAELEENIFGQVGWNCERDDDYHEQIGKVVAWMPLPKPWKGAEDETD